MNEETTTPETAISTKANLKPATLRGILNSEEMKRQFAAALPEHLTADRFVRVAITALTRTPKLAECSQASFFRCLLDLSAMGIEPDGRRAHLIPYGTECTLILDYKGIIELIRRSGNVSAIRAETVCERDEFSWQNGEISHSVNWREDRGQVEAAYAVATLKSGETQSAVMTRAEIEGIRARSKAGKSGPWVSDFSEMCKKTVVRRVAKMLPMSSELMDHVSKDDDQFKQERNVTPQIKLLAGPALPEAKEEGGEP